MLLEACGINARRGSGDKAAFGDRQVLRGTVKRQLTVIAEELAGLWKAPVSSEMFFPNPALSGMFDFCLYSKGGKNRYLLPVEIAKPLLGLVTCPGGMLFQALVERRNGLRYPVRCRKHSDDSL